MILTPGCYRCIVQTSFLTGRRRDLPSADRSNSSRTGPKTTFSGTCEVHSEKQKKKNTRDAHKPSCPVTVLRGRVLQSACRPRSSRIMSRWVMAWNSEPCGEGCGFAASQPSPMRLQSFLRRPYPAKPGKLLATKTSTVFDKAT